jgi:transposase
VKRESLEDFIKNMHTTRRYMLFIGRRCRESSIKAVAEEQNLDWKTVKTLEMEYMQEQLDNRPPLCPRVIGIDEISVKKGHKYRIVVSDLERGEPIWFGGEDRSEASMNKFYEELGLEKCKKIELAVMDMWKAFRNSAEKNIPEAAILFDKFHVIQHLNESLDRVRKDEHKRLKETEGEDYIKGNKYTLLSRRENLKLQGSESLAKILKANERLNVAYLLKEKFDQLWGYKNENDARIFFDKWKESLEGQNLKAYEKFAEMIERHWSGIARHCVLGAGIKLGYVEGLNNKIRVFQRRAYGLRDEKYLRLKILTFKLEPL